MKGEILIVEDERAMREALHEHLSARYKLVRAVSTLAEARAASRSRGLDAVVLDLHLPDGDGLDFLRDLSEISPDVPVIVITAYPGVEAAVRAFRGGACDFLQKPFGLSELDAVLDRQVLSRLAIAVGPICAPGCRRQGPDCQGHGCIVGSSLPIQRLREAIRRAARVPGMPVLIEGESGTGKELVARALHFESTRCRGPLVALNAAVLPRSLAESELFGHVKGSFTGAHDHHTGLFEQGHRGTVLLDEIGELSLDLQPKLLRVLETREIRRLGDSRTRPVDVRFVSATNRDLRAMVAEGAFREDLYYRVAVFRLRVPPLRERLEDVEAISLALLEGICAESGLEVRYLDERAVGALKEHDWPGNVRELRNCLYQAAALASGSTLRVEEVRAALGGGVARRGLPSAEGLSLREAELQHVIAVYEACSRNKSEAARRLGITRVTLRARLKEAGVT